MVKNVVKLAETIYIVGGQDPDFGNFRDVIDSRYAASGRDTQGEGFVCKWSDKFGMGVNYIKLMPNDLYPNADNVLIIVMCNDFINKLDIRRNNGKRKGQKPT